MGRIFSVAVLACVTLAGFSFAKAQDAKCTTTIECAQQMVASLASLNKADEELAGRIEKLSEELSEQISELKILIDEKDKAVAQAANRYMIDSVNNHLKTVLIERHREGQCPHGWAIVSVQFQFINGNAGPIGDMQPYCGRLKIVR